MLELMVLRHGKSDWDAEYGSDHERPLARRGRKAATRVGELLARADRVPDVAISSTAVRARTTAQRVLAEMERWGQPIPELETTRLLYGASVEVWGEQALEAYQGAEAEVDDRDLRILVAGHEPTCSAVVQALTGARCRFPTAAVATVRVGRPESLGALGEGGPVGELQFFVIPRLL